MTKSELIEVIAQRTQITKGRAELMVNQVFDAMAESLERGEGIEVRGFGSFTVRDYKPYKGRNPKTNVSVDVGPKKLPFFKVGKDLRDQVNSRAGSPPPVEDGDFTALHRDPRTDPEPDEYYEDDEEP